MRAARISVSLVFAATLAIGLPCQEIPAPQGAGAATQAAEAPVAADAATSSDANPPGELSLAPAAVQAQPPADDTAPSVGDDSTLAPAADSAPAQADDSSPAPVADTAPGPAADSGQAPSSATEAPVQAPAIPAQTLPARQASERPAPATSPAPAQDETAAKRRDTIRYGIDAQIQALLKELATERNDAFDEDLLALFRTSKSPRLRASILDFMSAREWKGAEADAIRLVEDRDLNDPTLVGSALYYLAAVRSKAALGLAATLAEEGDKMLQPALLRLLGRAGGPDEVEILLRWIDGEGSSDAVRQEAVRALGDIGSARASDRLEEIVADADAGKALRMLACEALGNIKAPSSVAALTAAANGEDPNVRTSAIEALASFPGRDAEAAIIEALRDSYAKARIAACKAAGGIKSAAAVPFLRYKAGNDPEKAVRQEAIRALAAIGGDSFSFLRERLKDPKEDSAMRALCFGLLARYDAQASMDELSARLAAEALEKDKTLYKAFAREVSLAEGAPGAVVLARMLLGDKDFQIRIAALEWAKRNDPASLSAELETLAKDDPAEPIKKRAKELLASIRGAQE